MAQRVLKRDVDAAFANFLEAVGGETVAQAEARKGSPVGGFELYMTGAGRDTGYRIDQVVNEARGVDTPFGDRLRTAREFVDATRFAVRVLGQVQRQGVGV
jgi:hypothetical protein